MVKTAGAAIRGDREGGDGLLSVPSVSARPVVSCFTKLTAVGPRSLIASFAVLVFCVVAPPPVGAQQQRTDPDASSPAGVIYEIPFDTARKDAAPKESRSGANRDRTKKASNNSSATVGAGGPTSGSGDGGTGAGMTPASGATRSGAGGDTSSSGAGGGSSAGKSSSNSAATGSAPSNPNVGTSIHSENGFGSSSRVPGVAASTAHADEPPPSVLQADASSSSSAPGFTYGLLVIMLIVGGWIGLAAGRALRVSH